MHILHLSPLPPPPQAGDRSLAIFSKLLGVDGPQMAHWLCHRRLAVGGEMLIKPMSGQQAVGARDALAKHIYGQLFTWTVQRLNSALRSKRGKARSFIGVLDIYGWATSFVTLDAPESKAYLVPLEILSCSLTLSYLSEQVRNLRPEQFWAVLYQLCEWKTATTVQQGKSRDKQMFLLFSSVWISILFLFLFCRLMHILMLVLCTLLGVKFFQNHAMMFWF